MNSLLRTSLLSLTSALLLPIASAHAAQEYLVMTPLDEVRHKCDNDLPRLGVGCSLDGNWTCPYQTGHRHPVKLMSQPVA